MLKTIGSFMWDLKVSLQFTGWLQYVPTLILGLLLLLLAAGLRALKLNVLSLSLMVLAIFFLLLFLFDLVTVKLRLHPAETLPERLDNLDLFNLLRARRSCRSFQNRRLTPAHHRELMGYVAAHLAIPTIGQAPIRIEYLAAPLTVWPVVGASEFLVALAPAEYNRLAVIDVGRTLQKIVIEATRMGLGTCWIGPGADRTSVATHLGDRFDPEKDHVICVCAVGYRSQYLPTLVRLMNYLFHQRLPLSELFFADPSFQQPLPVTAAPFNQFGRTYEVCQWSPSSYNGQTTRCVGSVLPAAESDSPPVSRFDFYTATASRYYAAVALGIWCANWEMGCEALDIAGRLEMLSPGARVVDTAAPSGLPRYDVSWVQIA